MKTSNAENSNINKEEKSLSHKDKVFYEFNKKLEDFISNIKTREFSSEKRSTNYLDSFNNNKKKMGNTQNSNNKENNLMLDNIKMEENNKNIVDENKLREASKRIKLEEMIESDQFAENYYLIPSKNYDYNTNDIPYIQPFDDNKFCQDESLFFAFDNNYKNKFISKEDIKKIKKEDIKLSFGIDPFEIYGQLAQGKLYQHDKISIDFYNSVINFNEFRSIDPNFLNIGNNYQENEEENNNYINTNCDDNEQGSNVENNQNSSQNSTRQNSKFNMKTNQKSSIIIKEKNFLFNTKKNASHQFHSYPVAFFFDNILYTYLIHLQTEYPNFHANSATLISM